MLNPWPIPADSYGMMSQFWLADGNYRARATNADGSITYFDQPSILALGASSGAAPSGGVDPNAIFATGDVIWLDKSGTKAGWVRDNGRTLGNGVSGASERANADCQALFEYLWNTFSNTICPVLTGRGASGTADFNAGKQITLPDKRGCAAVGADDMGNTNVGRLSGAPIVSGTTTAPGSVLGENSHQLSEAEMPSHSHTGSGTTSGQSANHTHSQIASVSVGSYSSGGSNGPLGNGSQTGPASNDHVHDFGFETDGAGGDGSHNNIARSVVGTFYRKL